MKIKKILVTGGGGFLGSFICEKLIERGDEVFSLDMAVGEKVEHLKIKEGFHYFQDSVLDFEIIERLVSQVDMVFHFAAIADPRRYVQEPLNVLNVGLLGTINVLKALATKKDRAKIVFASTSEVYGKNEKVPWKEDDDRVLGSTSINRWSYSSAKAVCEHYIKAYQQEKGVPFTIFRFFNVYGPRVDDLGFGRVIPIFLEKCFKGENIPVHGDGKQTRSFTYIDDVVAGIIQASFSSKCENQILNIGSEKETAILELADLLIKTGGFQSGLEFIPASNLYGKSFENIPRRVPCVDKIYKLIGWKANVSLEEGLAKTIEYFKGK